MLGAGLAPDRGAAGQALRARIAQTPHAVQRAEVVIERAVLLHEDHDVLDVHDRAGAMARGMAIALASGGRQQARTRCANGGGAEERAAVGASWPHLQKFDFGIDQTESRVGETFVTPGPWPGSARPVV